MSWAGSQGGSIGECEGGALGYPAGEEVPAGDRGEEEEVPAGDRGEEEEVPAGGGELEEEKVPARGGEEEEVPAGGGEEEVPEECVTMLV